MSAPAKLDLAALETLPLPSQGRAVDKNSRGRVLVVGGGAWGPGAALLTGVGALRAGAGKVQIAAADRFAPSLATTFPEAAILTVPATDQGEFRPEGAELLRRNIAHADAVIIGPGMLDKAAAAHFVRALMTMPTEAALVVDAAAVTGLSLRDDLSALAGRLVMTPHAGEMASLLKREKAEIEADPLGAAREAAAAFKAVVVMKGADTHVVSPDGGAWLHRDGVVGLATSGSGDVLAGVVGGLLARGASPLTAAAWGVCVHAQAGRRLTIGRGATGFLARELLPEIPAILQACGSGQVR